MAHIIYKEAETLPEVIDAIRLRVEVFIKEQGFEPGWEPDEEDKKSQHFIATLNGKTVATARSRETSPGEIKIERMVVKKEYRGQGIGKGLLEYITKQLRKKKPKRVWMQSQTHKKRFYESCGFKTISKPFDLYGTPHVEMEHI